MGEIWVKEFPGGLDTRKLPETSAGGTLIFAQDCHVNRGSELEQRAAFVSTYTLPAGTKGLFATATRLVVFGDAAQPNGLPSGFTYQRLQHPDGVTPMKRILSAELYAGKVYAVAEYVDGGIFHFYNASRVTDFADIRARAAVTITNALANGIVSSITVGGTEVLGASVAVPASGLLVDFAAAIAAQINTFRSTPEIIAVAYQNVVNIISESAGSALNGAAVVVTASSVATSPGSPTMAGGKDAGAGTAPHCTITVASGSSGGSVSSIKLNGVEILSAPVPWPSSNSTTDMAAALANQIRAFSSNPDYDATASAAVVTVTGILPTDQVNGLTPVIVASNVSLTLTAMSGGVEPLYQAGPYVRTGNKRLFSLTGSEAHFSGIDLPTQWFSQNAAGAGFVDMSNEASNAQTLTAVGKFISYYAFFAPRTTQIWSIDADPANNGQIQVLGNTGTRFPRSVVQFGDSDLFYLDASGVRSLRARYATLVANTTDVGNSVDTAIIADAAALDDHDVISIIEPTDGRVWVALGGKIYVFSFFQGAKVSAWTTYAPGFFVEDMIVFNSRVHLRSGDKVYVYGGVGSSLVYDDTPAQAWLPYLDANAPNRTKKVESFDSACRGVWEFRAAMDPNNLDASDLVARFDGTTFGPDSDINQLGAWNHISVRMKSVGQGPHTLASVLLKYAFEDGADE